MESSYICNLISTLAFASVLGKTAAIRLLVNNMSSVFSDMIKMIDVFVLAAAKPDSYISIKLASTDILEQLKYNLIIIKC